MANPDKSRKVYSEKDVTTPAGLKCNDAYDLTLYHDLSGGKKGVLVVSMDIQITFKDGKDKSGGKLTWDHGSRTQFVNDYTPAIKSAWNDKWKITTSSSVSAITEVSVIFEPKLIVQDWYWGDHWEIEVEKTDSFLSSYVRPLLGDSKHYSTDLQGAYKGANQPGCSGGAACQILQRDAVHEFGHMLGLRDEYPVAKDNTDWLTDGASIMHMGESVRPRHYAIFAAWLTEQYAYAARLAKDKIDFKVDGTWDLTNSKL